jgi:hypothetical protein
MLITSAIRKRKTNGFAATLTFLLIAFCIAGNAQLEALHQFLHSHHHGTSHSQTDEQDACHRTIYHQDVEDGCGHQSHIVVTEKCALCDLISHPHQIFLSEGCTLTIDFVTIDFPICVSDEQGSVQLIRSPRAPPSV